MDQNIIYFFFSGDRCIADYYSKYLDALKRSGNFYRRPLGSVPPKYGNQTVGVNKLKTMMKEIASRAELQGNFTNHSGKRTCATQLYMSGIDEQEIMARTGHRSEKAVRKYKQSCSEISKKVSAVLDPPALKRKTDSNISDEPVTCKKPSIENVNSSIENVNPSFENVKPSMGNVAEKPHTFPPPNDSKQPLRDITNGATFQNCQISFRFWLKFVEFTSEKKNILSGSIIVVQLFFFSKKDFEELPTRRIFFNFWQRNVFCEKLWFEFFFRNWETFH